MRTPTTPGTARNVRTSWPTREVSDDSSRPAAKRPPRSTVTTRRAIVSSRTSVPAGIALRRPFARSARVGPARRARSRPGIAGAVRETATGSPSRTNQTWPCRATVPPRAGATVTSAQAPTAAGIASLTRLTGGRFTLREEIPLRRALRLRRRPDDHDRAGGLVRHLRRGRAEQRGGEVAAPAVPDDDEIRVRGGSDEWLGRPALDYGDRRAVVGAENRRDLRRRGFLRGLAGHVEKLDIVRPGH